MKQTDLKAEKMSAMRVLGQCVFFLLASHCCLLHGAEPILANAVESIGNVLNQSSVLVGIEHPPDTKGDLLGACRREIERDWREGEPQPHPNHGHSRLQTLPPNGLANHLRATPQRTHRR